MRFVLYVGLVPHLVLVEKVFHNAGSVFGETPELIDKNKDRQEFMTWMRR